MSTSSCVDDDPAALRHWLRLVLSDGVGADSARRLLQAFGLPGHLFHATPVALKEVVSTRVAAAVLRTPSPVLTARIDASLAFAAQAGNGVLTLADEAYPRALLEIADPPPLLYVRGRLELLQNRGLAVVGSRNATRQGIEHAAHFSTQLSKAGVTIVSGLALGIDTAAHEGGLLGAGSTIAVIGTGIDIDYPARNAVLAREIATHGCIVSEYPLGMPPLAANFPRRNRLISGLAQAVLVVEAAAQSGSLITARMAAEQGRDVLAIPGSIHSPLAKGCHQLIRQGAKLVETTQDILEELVFPHSSALLHRQDEIPASMSIVGAKLDDGANDCLTDISPETSLATIVLAAMGHDPVDADTLAVRCERDAATLAAVLLELELSGHIDLLPGARYRRAG